MDFDLRLIRYLVALSEAPSFTEAAAALHVSQPALSQGIKRLERIVGAPLIDRAGKGFTRGATLTGAGEIVLAAGRTAMSDLDRAFILARAEASRLEVRIGFGSTTPRALSTGIIELLSRLGDPDISLKFLSWGEEIEHLLRGDVGMAFLQMAPDFEDDALLMEHVCDIERVAVFAAGHPLAGAAELTMADLLDEPILDAATGDRDFWIVDPREAGRAPVVVGPAARTVDEMLAFVAAGKGMAITTVSVAEKNGSPALAFVPVTDLQPAVIRLVMNPADTRRGVRPLFDKVHAEAVAVLRRS